MSKIEFANFKEYASKLESFLNKKINSLSSTEAYNTRICKSFITTSKQLISLTRDLAKVKHARLRIKSIIIPGYEKVKDNEELVELDKKISSIDYELFQEDEYLTKIFFKLREKCHSQYSTALSTIKDETEATKVREVGQELEDVLFTKNNELDSLFGPTTPINLEERKEVSINEETEKRSTNINELLESLEELHKTMAKVDEKLETQIKKELKSIEVVSSPRSIALNKETLERLKQSELVKYDLEQLGKIFGGINLYSKTRKKLNSIGTEIDKISVLIQSALQKEADKELKLMQEQRDYESEAKISTDTVQEHEEILDKNEEIRAIAEDKSELSEKRKEISEEKSQLISDKLSTEQGEIVEIDEIKEKKDEIHEIQNKENEILSSPMITELPEQYVDMKQKLKDLDHQKIKTIE